MKKGLSVLLIAAALFGFYGGATSLTDVLASKDYWEEQGEKSTADMNKLEDGLNQLKDNEKAYLDGQKTLADGEKKLAEGEAQYAQGLADYAAAPAKLAQGERDLAAGKAQLAQGYADYAAGKTKLANAIASRAALYDVRNKISAVESAYSPWLQQFNKLVASIVDNPKKPSKGVLYDVGATAVGLATINDGFDTVEKTGKDGMAQIEAGVRESIIDTVWELLKEVNPETTRAEAEAYAEAQGYLTPEAIEQAISKSQYAEAYAKAKGAVQLAGYLKKTYSTKLLTPAGSINGKIENVKGAEYQATELRNSAFSGDLSDAAAVLDAFLSDQMVTSHADSLEQLIGGARQVKGLVTNAQNSTAEYNKNYDKLKPTSSMGRNIGSKVAAASKAILSNTDIVATMTGAQREALKPYMSSNSITGLPNIELLYGTMTLGTDKKDDGKGSLLDNFRLISDGAGSGIGLYDDGIRDGEEELAAAPAKLADGERQVAEGEAKLAQGYADYAAAPAKLADAEKQLADGRKQLADGKKKLAEYEDGEQQVRDGLATLMATKADPGLESILDRRNGDDKFDDEKGHLQLDEGLEAVDTGRGYQADSGELITKEVTNRAIGTAAGLGAAALAVLAAVLSFLKKNKGAAVSAVLAAVAGGIGAGVGFGAGEYYSDIAGSTVGNTPFIAAAVLAAVAVVFAIAHFTAQPEAKPEAK